MPLPRTIALLNKRYTNRFIEPVVRRTPGFAVVTHTGRKSGRTYQTPIYAFGADESFVVSLTYGPGADWVQNVLASGGRLLRHNTEFTIANSSIVGRSEAWPTLPRAVRLWLRLLRVTHFLHLNLTTPPTFRD